MACSQRKTGPDATKAFQDLWKTWQPQRLWTDKAEEFYNKSIEELLENNNVELYSTENEEKSSVVERWDRRCGNTLLRTTPIY